jgi:hypothetical protein
MPFKIIRGLIKLSMFFFLHGAFAQGSSSLPFLEKIYALNCDQSPHEIIYFTQHPTFGVVSLYPDTSSNRVTAITGSAWGNFYVQRGETFQFEKNGFIENRAVWIHENKLALIHSNGQFRDKQRFYQYCGANSSAHRFIQSGNKLQAAYAQFEKSQNQMIRSEKSSKCLGFNIARQTCASAGSYERCMSIRYGEDWAAKELECK